MGSMLSFLGRQLFITPQPADPRKYGLEGQCGLVTGSNVGLGFEAAKQLLGLRLSKLILAVRSQERGEEARCKLAAEFPNAEILVWIVDMASYDSIQEFVAQCDTLPRLDLAILNAGVVHFEFGTNESTGHEETIQVNVLSTALLASLLLPVLASKEPAGPGKLTIVGSEVAEWTKFKEKSKTPILPQLDMEKSYDGGDHYYVSKLLVQYFLIEAAKRIDPNKVILNVVNPGFCYGSSLHRNIPGVIGKVFGGVKRAIGRTCEVGARPIVKAAVVEGKSSHGKFYSDNGIAQMAPLTRGAAGEKLGGQVFKEIMEELKSYNAEETILSMG